MANSTLTRKNQFRNVASDIAEYLQDELVDSINQYQEAIAKALNTAAFKREFQDFVKELQIQRTKDGYSIYSAKFRAVSYNKTKAYKNAKEKKIAKYASRRKTDFMQLTGNLLNDMRVKITDVVYKTTGSVSFKIQTYFSTKRSRLIAEGLQTQSSKKRIKREFVGLAKSGKYVKSENDAINDFVFSWLDANGYL